MSEELTPEKLRALVEYDRDSGVFTARVRLAARVRAGDRLGSEDKRGYRQIRLSGKAYYEHRLAFLHVEGRWPAEQVDHIDGHKSRNAWSNLREATGALNMQNQRRAHSRNLSGKLGVRSHKGKYQAKIKAGATQKHLGTYEDADSAHQAYLRAKAKIHPYGEAAK